MNKDIFLRDIQRYQSDRVFNPYLDVCDLYDSPNSPKIRLKNLRNLLDSFLACETDSLWIGRDLGYKGGRRTGIAFTDEAHLMSASKKWNVYLEKATKGENFTERTATNIWRFVNQIDQKIFMWNVFPFHPHEANNPYSNRNHVAKERNDGMDFLDTLAKLIKPKRIVAIGNNAYACSCKIFPSADVYKVRHPSYGGENIFSKQITKIYKNVK